MHTRKCTRKGFKSSTVLVRATLVVLFASVGFGCESGWSCYAHH